MAGPGAAARPAVQAFERPAKPLGATRDGRRRLLVHHLPLALTSGLLVVLYVGLAPSHRGLSLSRFVTATGYVAFALLALTLLVGPANLLLGRRNPVNSYLRRDIGTWTALASVVHVILALQVDHGDGVLAFVAFFVVDGRLLTTRFGLGNWTGLAALVIVVWLLAMSTDRTLRELKGRRWKSFQRLSYALPALVALHAYFYGALSPTSSFRTVLLFNVVTVFVGQAVGIWLWRRTYSAASD
jgi:sulfoxide reductase heme-binding subunit YedZ